jgi:putative spermidine/putrescine transport system permease protein
MTISRRTRLLIGFGAGVALAFIYVPLIVVLVNSFNVSKVFSWPPRGWTVTWWDKALVNEGVRTAVVTSVKAGLGATAIAMVLGSMFSVAVVRYRWFGRDSLSLLVLLPIALPGIVTGIALNSSFRTVLGPLGISFGLFTVVLGHATFCIVVVFNNLIARLRRVPGSLAEASMDLGARGWQTLRFVTIPLAATALVSGALLAFALSFDEVIVTVFTAGAQNTLPLWIFGAIRLGQQLPEVNVVVTIVIALTLIPVILAARIAGSGAVTR